MEMECVTRDFDCVLGDGGEAEVLQSVVDTLLCQVSEVVSRVEVEVERSPERGERSATKVEVVVSSTALVSASADKVEEIVMISDDEDENMIEIKSGSGGVISAGGGTVKELDHEIKTILKMDVAEEQKENIEIFVKQMKRKELEDAVLERILQSINTQCVIGTLRSKLLQLHATKDKLFQKSSSLQKQVTELNKALKNVAENQARNPKAQVKLPAPLKFYRSVGLQVSVDPKATLHASVRSSVARIEPNSTTTSSSSNNSMNNSTTTPVRHQNGISPSSHPTPGLIPLANSGITNTSNANGISTQGLKRILKPTVTVAEVSKQIQMQQGQQVSKVARRSGVSGGATGRVPTPIQPQPQNMQQQQQQQMRNPAAQAASNAVAAAAAAQSNNTSITSNGTSTIVDLTDDDRPTTNNNNVILDQNGVQYRLVTQPAQGMQLVTSGAGYHIVTPGGQTRPIVFTQQPVQQQQQTRQQAPVQTVVFRNVAPRPQLGNQMRPSVLGKHNAIGPTGVPPRIAYSSNTNSNMIRSFNTSNTNINNLNSSNMNSPKKFVLPSLPPPSTLPPRKGVKDLPPRPDLNLQEQDDGIVLSWTLQLGHNHAEIQTYQIYACQEPLLSTAPKINQWKRVGDVKALPLPMACTLSQFTDENRYHFIVRGVDVHNRSGPFCDPVAIVLKKKH